MGYQSLNRCARSSDDSAAANNDGDSGCGDPAAAVPRATVAALTPALAAEQLPNNAITATAIDTAANQRNGRIVLRERQRDDQKYVCRGDDDSEAQGVWRSTAQHRAHTMRAQCDLYA
jgi:hypothetical protein